MKEKENECDAEREFEQLYLIHEQLSDLTSEFY